MDARIAIGVSLLQASLTLAAQAEWVDIVWSSDGSFTQRKIIAAGKFVEVCGKLPADQKLAWSFETTAPIDFNIHYHQGYDVVYPTKRSQVARGQDTLQTKVEQDYCWMWTNKTSGAVTLKASFRR